MSSGLPSSGEDEVFAPSTRQPRPLAGQGAAFAAVAAGGALGALARYGAAFVLPDQLGAFPVTTFLVNVTGCLLMGAVIVVVTEVRAAHPLVRPFLATGVLGGFTTFSTYALDVEGLLLAGRTWTACTYLVGTLTAAVAATWIGLRLARTAAGGR